MLPCLCLSGAREPGCPQRLLRKGHTGPGCASESLEWRPQSPNVVILLPLSISLQGHTEQPLNGCVGLARVPGHISHGQWLSHASGALSSRTSLPFVWRAFLTWQPSSRQLQSPLPTLTTHFRGSASGNQSPTQPLLPEEQGNMGVGVLLTKLSVLSTAGATTSVLTLSCPWASAGKYRSLLYLLGPFL